MIQQLIEDVSRETLSRITRLKSNETLTFQDSSYLAILISQLYKTDKGRLLIVSDQEDRISKLIEDLETCGVDVPVIHYEEQDYQRIYSEESELQLISERIESLRLLQDSEKAIICLSAKSLAYKVSPPLKIIEEKVVIKLGQELDFEGFQQKLFSMGFKRDDFVMKPGEYAVRGGIVDVFGFGLEHPIRLEFWGNMIESIREFDVKSQRSLDIIQESYILPNIQKSKKTGNQVCLLEYANETDYLLLLNADHIQQTIHEEIENYQSLVDAPATSLMTGSDLEWYFTNLTTYRVEVTKDTVSVNHQRQLAIQEKTLKEDLKRLLDENYTLYFGYDMDGQIQRVQSYIQDDSIFSRLKPFRPSLHDGFFDSQAKIAVLSEHHIFSRFRRISTKHKIRVKYGAVVENPFDLHRGDYVVHTDHGIGRFVGLTKLKIGNKLNEVVKIEYAEQDHLFVNVKAIDHIQKFSSKDGYEPVLSKLGATDWQKKKETTKKKIKDIARDLILLYAKRKNDEGFTFSPDTPWQSELEASFMFEDTPDQTKTMVEIKADMEKPFPMDRLLCGDVGFGKTEIAVRAAFKAMQDGKQVAVLVPTTILAEQHFHTFTKRMAGFPVKVETLSRFRSSKDAKEIKERVKSGATDLVIGTHSLLAKDMVFNSLGLLVIDEEHRFGVADKERIKALKTNVDVLSMSATPIPRTMQLSMMGARDISIIATPPPNRIPVRVKIQPFSEPDLKQIINEELKRNGQIFFIHNRVKSIYNVATFIQRLMPKIRFRVAHGQMPPKELEDIMVGFLNHDFDMLIATNIIESGVDIPNANTIIINRADRFGLSELYQLKGRVGRSNRQAFCYLLTPPMQQLKKDAVRRLLTIEEYTDLGSGFNVAMRDLDIRGAGNILGAEQSGYINTIGFEMYHQILEEAVTELKDEEFSHLFDRQTPDKLSEDVTVESIYLAMFPEEYIENIAERFDLYKRLAQLKRREDILDLKKELEDRFGPVPTEADILIHESILKLTGQKIGAVRIYISADQLLITLPEKNDRFYKQPYFENILKNVQKLKQRTQLKEVKNHLQIQVDIRDLKSSNPIEILQKINELLDVIRPI